NGDVHDAALLHQVRKTPRARFLLTLGPGGGTFLVEKLSHAAAKRLEQMPGHRLRQHQVALFIHLPPRLLAQHSRSPCLKHTAFRELVRVLRASARALDWRSGLARWTGAVDWRGGLARRTGAVDGRGGLARGTGAVDWRGGLAR